MIINNFGDLKAKLSSYMWHARQAPDYDLMVVTFERAANRRLRALEQETLIYLTTVNGACIIPSDYLHWRAVIWGTNPEDEMDYVHPVYLNKREARKRLFTVERDQFKTNPVDDTADKYEFHYYQKIPSITGQPAGDLATNWLLTAHPDAYEWGCVMELAAIGRNREMAELYKARRDEVFAEIMRVSSLTTGATSPAVRETAEWF